MRFIFLAAIIPPASKIGMQNKAKTTIIFWSISVFCSPWEPKMIIVTQRITTTTDMIVYAVICSPKNNQARNTAKKGDRLQTTLVVETLKCFIAV